MFKVLVVLSDHSEAPLAEIRTDGRNLEWVVDNTDGHLPATIGSDVDALYSLVKRSSHLRIEQQKKATVRLLRYILDNGDTVEMTDDGKTCILNGQILAAPEKDALFAALTRGEIKVVQRADPSQPIPVMPVPPMHEKPEPSFQKPEYDPKIIKGLADAEKERKNKSVDDSVALDKSIESVNTDGQDPLQAEMSKNMLYYAKYGQFKGGVDA